MKMSDNRISTEVKSCKIKGRFFFKDMYLRRIGDFWSQRPLTCEMLEFAADDVMSFIPEVYRRQSE